MRNDSGNILVLAYVLFGMGFAFGYLAIPANAAVLNAQPVIMRFLTIVAETIFWPFVLGLYIGNGLM